MAAGLLLVAASLGAGDGLTDAVWSAPSRKDRLAEHVRQKAVLAMSSEETKSSLLIRIRNCGDAAAWREFNAIYRPVVRSYAAHFGVPQQDLDDLVQDTFLAVSTLIGDFEYDRSRGRFRSWLWSVTHRRVLKWQAGQRRAPIVPEDSQFLDRVDDSAADLEKYWDKQWRQHALSFALERAQQHFSPRVFEAFRRYAVLGRPAKEVAEDVGMTVEHLYVSKGRVLAWVRQEVEQYDG